MEQRADNKLLPLEGNQFLVKQSFEMGEIFDFETRNKYKVYEPNGQQILHIAEQQKGILGFLFRQMGGHTWRKFTLHFFDTNRNLLYIAKHPFCWCFQTLEVYDHNNYLLGSFKTRFAFLKRKVDVLDSRGHLLWNMQTKMNILFNRWKYPFFKNGKQVACIDKKFSGIFEEIMTDKDNFVINVEDRDVSRQEKILLIAAAVFFDIRYFEKKN